MEMLWSVASTQWNENVGNNIIDSSEYWGMSASDNICTHMSPPTVNIGFLSGKAPLQTALWQEKCFQKELLPDFNTLTDNVW